MFVELITNHSSLLTDHCYDFDEHKFYTFWVLN